MYYPDGRECILNSESRTTQPTYYADNIRSERVNYYDNKCNNGTMLLCKPYSPDEHILAVTPSPTNTSIRCEFLVDPQHVLVGFVDQAVFNVTFEQCLNLCFSSPRCKCVLPRASRSARVLTRVTRRMRRSCDYSVRDY